MDKMLSLQSVIDYCKPARFFTNSSSAGIYKFIACKLHNSLFVSVPKRNLCARYWTVVQYIAEFRVLLGDLSFCAHEFSLAERNFEEKSPFVQANYRSICCKISGKLSNELSPKNHRNKERNSHISLSLLLHNTVCVWSLSFKLLHMYELTESFGDRADVKGRSYIH